MFKKAVKNDAKLRLGISGPSGSGKTFTALSIATNLTDKPVALVDTEHGSASKYADIFNFDVMEMSAPFHPDKYAEAIRDAAQAGYGVIILDSLTHAWKGEGGILELVTEIAKRKYGGNSYAAWNDATPIQKRMIEAIVSAPIHVIATMRSKMDYIQEKDERGKSVIRKVGMAPEQRDDMPYEFDVMLDMNVDNEANVSKTRCPDLTGRLIAKPGKQVAEVLRKWLSGNPAPAQQPLVTQTPEQRQPIAIESRTNDAASATPVTEPTGQDLNDEQLQIAAGRIAAGMKAPTDAWQWAAEGKHTENEHSARTRWTAIVKDQGGYKPEKFAAIATAFVAHYLAKPVAA